MEALTTPIIVNNEDQTSGRVNSEGVTIVPCSNCGEDTVWMSYTDLTYIPVEPEIEEGESEHAIHYCKQPPADVIYYTDDEIVDEIIG